MEAAQERRISRTYIFRRGGWGIGDDEPWYDENEVTCYEGDKCPECNRGELLVSKKGNLYCSEICWEDE